MVSGCYDMLHIGHVRFLEQAAELGCLTVCVATDRTIQRLKGRVPEIGEVDRLEMVQALRCVNRAVLSPGTGWLDFEPCLRELKPDILVVNFDGQHPGKRELCHELGVEYRVIDQRTGPHTTQLRQRCRIPYRIDIAGGWLDQPMVSVHCPGPVIVASVEPDHEFNLRSGMATSTRETAKALWGCQLPQRDPEEIGRILFACENPPGKQEVAGSQDALGIVLPGLNRLDYAGEYWPVAIQRSEDNRLLSWLESHVRLLPTPERPESFSVLSQTNITKDSARRLSTAASNCWDAMGRQDVKALGETVTEACRAQLEMFPLMRIPSLERAWDDSRWLGAKLCGAGGGGYILAIAANASEIEGMRLRFVRPGLM